MCFKVQCNTISNVKASTFFFNFFFLILKKLLQEHRAIYSLHYLLDRSGKYSFLTFLQNRKHMKITAYLKYRKTINIVLNLSRYDENEGCLGELLGDGSADELRGQILWGNIMFLFKSLKMHTQNLYINILITRRTKPLFLTNYVFLWK